MNICNRKSRIGFQSKKLHDKTVLYDKNSQFYGNKDPNMLNILMLLSFLKLLIIWMIALRIFFRF
jgi:hypothetical protein